MKEPPQCVLIHILYTYINILVCKLCYIKNCHVVCIYIYIFDMYDNHKHIKHISDTHTYTYMYIFTVNINIFAGKDSIIYKPIVSYSLFISLNDLYCTISYLFLARYFA